MRLRRTRIRFESNARVRSLSLRTSARFIRSAGRRSRGWILIALRTIIRPAEPPRLRRGTGHGIYRFQPARKDRPAFNLQKPAIPLSDHSRLVFPAHSHPAVSLIVPAYDNWSYTDRCLTAVLCHTLEVPYEVILADDSSTDETRNASERIKNIQVICATRRQGFLHNVNHAATHARGKYLVLLNNDTVVQPRWLSRLVSTAEGSRDVGIVGPKVIYDDGRLQEAGGSISCRGHASRLGQYQDASDPSFNVEKDVDYVSGCCLLIGTTLWRELDGFDERYAPGYYEDVDLAFRVRERGYRVVYQPLAVVAHTEGATHGHDPSRGAKRFIERNETLFRERWAKVLQDRRFDRSGAKPASI